MTAFIASTSCVETGGHRLLCRGRIDARAAAWLRRELDALVDVGAQQVVMDFGQADHIDAAAVVTLASGLRALRHRGATISVVPPVEAASGRLLDYCGIGSSGIV